jgi:putative membrane protein
VREVEADTSAELVVMVRWESGHYRDTDYLVGFALSILTLMGLLYLPHEFPLWLFALDVPVSFAIGSLLSMTIVPLRRAFTKRARMEQAVRRAAHAEFFEHGVSKTTGRSGVLIYLSAFERMVQVVPDIGVDVEALGTAWKTALDALSACVEGGDVAGFLSTLESLGPILGEVYPRREGDVDELDDEADVAEAG